MGFLPSTNFSGSRGFQRNNNSNILFWLVLLSVDLVRLQYHHQHHPTLFHLRPSSSLACLPRRHSACAVITNRVSFFNCCLLYSTTTTITSRMFDGLDKTMSSSTTTTENNTTMPTSDTTDADATMSTTTTSTTTTPNNAAATAASTSAFVNVSETGEIPSFNGDAKAKATDFANYFCSYAQLYHQKQMLADHNRMAAYHAAITFNKHVFQDKVVMDIGTGSGILAVWAAQAGARKVYAIEYTDMAKHAQRVMDANGVSHIVTVIQGAVEDVELPMVQDDLHAEMDDDGNNNSSTRVVDIIISEWMGYFLLRESMLDSIIRARDKFLKPKTGLMFPSHTTMYIAPVTHEDDRKNAVTEFGNAMNDWYDFAETTMNLYGVNMTVLENDFEREQKEYYLWSSRWTELAPEAILAEPTVIKQLDMITCTLQDARGIDAGDPTAQFDFTMDTDQSGGGPISALSGWFTADFRSRTDALGSIHAPKLTNPAFLGTGPENGFTHWGQQTFYLQSSIPLIRGERTRLRGSIEMQRTKENARLYNCRLKYATSRIKVDPEGKEQILMESSMLEQVYQMP